MSLPTTLTRFPIASSTKSSDDAGPETVVNATGSGWMLSQSGSCSPVLPSLLSEVVASPPVLEDDPEVAGGWVVLTAVVLPLDPLDVLPWPELLSPVVAGLPLLSLVSPLVGADEEPDESMTAGASSEPQAGSTASTNRKLPIRFVVTRPRIYVVSTHWMDLSTRRLHVVSRFALPHSRSGWNTRNVGNAALSVSVRSYRQNPYISWGKVLWVCGVRWFYVHPLLLLAACHEPKPKTEPEGVPTSQLPEAVQTPVAPTDPQTPRRCVAPPGISAAPSSIAAAVALINALPPPVTVACFVESLDRPLQVVATASDLSAQPAAGFSA